MATRLAKAAGHHAIVVAAAALDRLGLAHEIAERLPVELVLPQVGQAALAVECRVDDRALLARLAAVDHLPTHRFLAAAGAFPADRSDEGRVGTGRDGTCRSPGRPSL